jgi:hypothetical protein
MSSISDAGARETLPWRDCDTPAARDLHLVPAINGSDERARSRVRTVVPLPL